MLGAPMFGAPMLGAPMLVHNNVKKIMYTFKVCLTYLQDKRCNINICGNSKDVFLPMMLGSS